MATGYYKKVIRIKESATPIDNVNKFAWDNDDYEEIEVWHDYTDEELTSIKEQQAQQEQKELINSLPDAIADLSSDVSNNATSTNDLMDAIADLSAIVSDLSTQVILND